MVVAFCIYIDSCEHQHHHHQQQQQQEQQEPRVLNGLTVWDESRMQKSELASMLRCRYVTAVLTGHYYL
jgi:hypothetical protein